MLRIPPLITRLSLVLVHGISAFATRPRYSLSWLEQRGVYSNRPDMPSLSESSAQLGVDPPLRAPKLLWRTAWNIGRGAMPVLHYWDTCRPTDTNVNLWVCWLKAIAGNRRHTADGGYAYDLLPGKTRAVVSRPFARLYPRLHHQNVAMRTAFIDKALTVELQAAVVASALPVVVVLGAGFDVRSIRLGETLQTSNVTWAECDLPHVVAQKQRMLNRLAHRRPPLASRIEQLVQLPANLSDAEEARAALRSALASTHSTPGGLHAIYVLEALLIYLPPANAATLLRSCVEEAEAAGANHVTLCFADRLPDVHGCEYMDAKAALARHAGLELDESSWLPKPGLARHMGVARWQRSRGAL